ncbi:MAG: acyl-CoA reductase [Tenuifilaceae bacterium]|nr:acyl-CoA reductase [Tenuifilaceae bacterium]
MTLTERINAFIQLGERILKDITEDTLFNRTLNNAFTHNQWFTPEYCQYAIASIAKQWLTTKALQNWIKSYPNDKFNTTNPKRVAVIMAGNVPFVGFHDMLCTLLLGHHFVGKSSSKDGGLMQAIVDLLIEIEPQFGYFITLTDGKIDNFDAVIATGSDNSARYFEYYFGKYPSIIRKNRHSLAVLSGTECDEDLEALANDIFLYFGLGCRNVSKLLVPINFNFTKLIEAFKEHNQIINHNKYANNYDYHRAIYLMNKVEHLDSGFFLIKPDEGIGSPVGVIFYQNYSSIESANEYIALHTDMLQCIVSSIPSITNSIAFGKSQNPELTDYADGIDTIKFLSSL